MRILKSFLILIAFLQLGVAQAQDYKFIPKDQYLLSDEQVKTIFYCYRYEWKYHKTI